jgi:type IV pilus assembly protein PilY1
MTRTLSFRAAGAGVIGLLALMVAALPGAAQTPTSLADSPVFAGSGVPGNLALVLSVEYPTAVSVANLNSYADASTYLGYFDPGKCYSYLYNSTTPSQSYFSPTALATGSNGHSCSGKWSGNFMNWATMQTIDPFRWALTGGYRSVDNATGPPYTILEKAWGSLQGAVVTANGYWNNTSFPFRGTEQASPNNLPESLISTVTPFSNWVNFNSAIWANGNEMVFSGSVILTNGGPQQQEVGYYNAYGTTVDGNGNYTVTSSAATSGTVYDLPSNVNTAATLAKNASPQVPNATSNPKTYRVYVRVSVCDPTLGVAYLESNCVKYGSGSSTVYKPEGLLQQYANQIKYADLSYLNYDGKYQQGGVLREPMHFIGPTYPTSPLSTSVTTNANAEWSSTTGVQNGNPDAPTSGQASLPPTWKDLDSTASSAYSHSGVINYLNSFGQYGASSGNYSSNTIYMQNDNVSELYYAAIRYYENRGNVSQWSTAQGNTNTELDGFPAWTTWTDPIAYSCQQNFILGIGDDHTHFDYNTAGNGGATDPYITRTDPSPVSQDTFNTAATWLFDLEALEGISQNLYWQYYNGGGSYSTLLMAGLAYGAHVTDIRSDLTGTQTISTYWMDVEEYGAPEYQNPYYLATKYGGFTVPSNYSISNTTPLTQGSWTSGTSIQMDTNGNYTNPSATALQPNNYFLAGQASTMVSSLKSAFSSISASIQAYVNSFSFAGTTVAATGAATGTESFASQYNSSGWTGVVTASTLSFNSSGTAISTQLWSTSTTLQAQLAGTGWQAPFNTSTGRNIATWNGTTGVAFEATSITAAQLAALSPSSYASTTTSTQMLSYLRGDQSNEQDSTSTNSTKGLRSRTLLLGDIVDSNLTPVTTPIQVYTDANDPGYSTFKTTWANRPTMVYFGANDGMMHGFIGASGSGYEQFAYVPSALFQGPTGTPTTNGLVELGNPTYVHHAYVDATPLAFDIDLGNTNKGNTGGAAGTVNWRTLLIGGLGKGGKSYYAIDITNPAGMTSESAVAGNVKWEFTEPTMGYSYGSPIVVKTAQWGWVVAFTSGYDNSDGYGHLYLVNPSTGALIQDIQTPSASTGMTQASAYVLDYTDNTADSIYVGDLNGQLWRFPLTATSGNYPAPTLLATLTDSSGNQQPITTAPLIEISPTTRYRYVMVGTGQLLATTDIINSNMQTFYAIIDGTAGGFNAVSSPITRSNLTQVSSVLQGVTVSATSKGWYFDLGIDSTSGVAWRVVTNPAAYDGIVAFSALLTQGTDPCSPSGTSEVYAVNYANATSVIQSSLGSSTTVANVQVSGEVTSERFFINATTGSADFIVGTSTGAIPSIPLNYGSVSSTRLLNWREIPTAE